MKCGSGAVAGSGPEVPGFGARILPAWRFSAKSQKISRTDVCPEVWAGSFHPARKLPALWISTKFHRLSRTDGWPDVSPGYFKVNPKVSEARKLPA